MEASRQSPNFPSSEENLENRTYIVQPGDTLRGIALKFDTSVSWIKRQNKIFGDIIVTGDVLKIAPQSLDMIPPDPVRCTKVDTFNNFEEEAGTLYLIEDVLVWQPDSLSKRTFRIDLANYVQSQTMPHPDRTKALYMINYLEDLNDVKSLKINYFFDEKENMEKICNDVKRAAEKAKERKHVPNLDLQFILSQQDPKSFLPKSQDGKKKSMFQLPVEIKRKNSIDFANLGNDPTKTMPPPKRRFTSPQLLQVQMIGGPSTILNPQIYEGIRASLPFKYRNAEWKLLYRLSVDGASYLTFYRKTEKESPVVLVIKTNSNDIIGAFISSGLKFSRYYYGTGETFVFRTHPKYEAFKWAISNNDYFVSSTQTEISIGGGGSSAIWIDGGLLDAYSDPCSTFNSPTLTKTNHFKINDIEVWKIGLI